MDAQLLAYSLVAAGSAPAGNGEDKTYLLEVYDGELVEKPWVGGYATGETPIASDVRDNTSAVYLFPRGDDARLVFFVSTADLIECFAYDDADSPNWIDTKLGEIAKIVTGPNSKLSATLTPEGGRILAYEDTTGQLALRIRAPMGGEWEKLAIPSTQFVSGTNFLLLYIKNSLHLFYVGNDGSIHALVQDTNGQIWTDRIVENTNFDEPIRNFDVTIDPDNDTFLVCLLVGDYLWLSYTERGQTRLGEVMDDGRLDLDDKEQNGWFWCCYCTPPRYQQQHIPFF